jgi:NADPH:quinone reductase-like Zn-dependent oxidoreductase
MSMMRAVVVEVGSPNRLVLHEVEEPSPTPSETLVRVGAVSLNRGEVHQMAATSQAGFTPGWDVAGTVERAAEDGSGPPEGTGVVGLLEAGAWAELAAVPTRSLATLPEGVSFAQAATLPVAGLTALYTVEKGGGLLGKYVLITGASGGVGLFACRLARMSGARVVGLIRQADREALVREAGAHEVVTGNDTSSAREHGPYDLVLESVGGQVLAGTLAMLASGGTCISFGVSAGAESTIDVRSFYLTGGAILYGFDIFYEVLARPASEGLARLLRLVADGTLRPRIELEAPLEEIGDVAERLVDRDYAGKAVLHVG